MKHPWKHLIPEITRENIIESFKVVFGYEPQECSILHKEGELIVMTPSSYHSHGGFGYHTDDPVLDEDTDIYNSWGCTWNTDKNGDRFYYIDKNTGLPRGWDEVYAQEILIKYLNSLGQDKVIDISFKQLTY